MENIVYEFVNVYSLPNEFLEDGAKMLDVKKEDILNVQKWKSSDKDNERDDGGV